jgi:hypothetical protein
MKTKDIVRAINYLAPGAEFTFENTDLNTLVWLTPEIGQPTNEAIIAAIPAANAAIDDPRDQAKAAVLEKLGLTADELAAVLS